MTLKNYFIMFITLTGIWLLLNNSLAPQIVVSGLVVSLLLSLLFCRQCQVFAGFRLTPKSVLYAFLFLLTFVYEMIKANLDVARRVLTPSLPINPGIVEVKTRLKSKMARVVLANSITLTPGTFTMEIKGESLFIHWIDVTSKDVEKSTQLIVEKFEKYLEVMYG